MSSSAEEILVAIRGDNADLKKKLAQVERNVKKFGQVNEQVAKKGKKGFASLTGSAGLLQGGLVKAGLAVGTLLLSFKKMLALTERQTAAEKQRETVLQSTNYAAGLSAKELDKMAVGLQKVTNYGDEAIIEGQNLLLTFTKIGKEVFPQATETMLDMSVAFKQDMKTSAIQLGRALEDPIKGVTALNRIGVTFTKEQKNMIAGLQNSGDMLGAQTVVLDALAVQTKNSARAAAEASTGFTQVSNVAGDIAEDLGKKLLPDIKELSGSLLNAGESMLSVSKDGGILYKMLKFVTDGLTKVIRGWTLISEYMNQSDYAEQAAKYQKSAHILLEENKKLYKSYGSLKAMKDMALLGDTKAQGNLKIYEFTSKRIQKMSDSAQGFLDLQMETSDRMTAIDEKMKAENANLDAIIVKRNVDKDAEKIRADAEKASLAEKTDIAKQARTSQHDLEMQFIQSEADARIALVQKYIGVEMDLETLKDQTITQNRTKAADEYKRYLQSKLGLDTSYARGLTTVTQTASTFMASKNKALFNFGKALAISGAIINTARAATSVLADIPYPANLILMGTVIAAGGVQIGNIAAQEAPQAPAKTSSSMKVPQLAVGTFDIPNDGLHYLHQREMVIPKAFSEAIRSGQAALVGDGYNNTKNHTIVHTQVNLDGKQLTKLIDVHRDDTARRSGTSNYYRESVY